MLKNILLKLIQTYQDYIRVILPASCRFTPSCSDYAREAVVKYGCLRGGLKACVRLLSCHPFSGKAGYYPLE